MTAAAWTDLFRLERFRAGRVGAKTIGADQSWWTGTLDGYRVRVRIKPWQPDVSFFVTSNHRLRHGEGLVGAAVDVLDVELLEGPPELAKRIRQLVEAADTKGRRALVRVGERRLEVKRAAAHQVHGPQRADEKQDLSDAGDLRVRGQREHERAGDGDDKRNGNGRHARERTP